jgi:uncharacterized protein (DUF2147 family)
MAVLVTAPLGLSGTVMAGGQPTGLWRMADGKVTVKVSPCGPNYCGTVVALRKPHDGKGRPRVDKENPNPALRKRPVIGLTILRNMQVAGTNYWTGTIYNPDDGNTYSSNMQLQGGNTMRVQGCVASVFCKSMKFIRVN